MRKLHRIMNIRYIILMIILIISLTALLLSMSNYNDIKNYKDIIKESTLIEGIENINSKEESQNIVIIQISNDDTTI